MALTPTFDNGVVRLYQGDARRVLRDLPAESVHCVVTSPPYWGLRDYGLEAQIWDGDEGCEHQFDGVYHHEHRAQGSHGKSRTTDRFYGGDPSRRFNEDHQRHFTTESCLCGAWRGSLGLEPTIELYVHHIVEIFGQVRRVLRKDGTLWLNMGDSYAGSGRGMNTDGSQGKAGVKQQTKAGSLLDFHDKRVAAGVIGRSWVAPPPGLKPKDLCMMPARVALALRADGWWLRSDIVWSKPNPMPESVTDRPTRAHEYVFLLTKAERYYYDADAIREPSDTMAAWEQWAQADGRTMPSGNLQEGFNAGFGAKSESFTHPNGRNKRSVWEIATEAYPEAHFATFPQKLVEPCILAGTSERGVCADCGAPWERVLEIDDPEGRLGKGYHDHADDLGQGQRDVFPADGAPTKRTTGWRPTCECGREETVPGTVLDPFAGSSTVAYVAQRLGRRAIGIDLSAEYLALAEKRMRGQSLPMAL